MYKKSLMRRRLKTFRNIFTVIVTMVCSLSTDPNIMDLYSKGNIPKF